MFRTDRLSRRGPSREGNPWQTVIQSVQQSRIRRKKKYASRDDGRERGKNQLKI